jgi:hypothetical protein
MRTIAVLIAALVTVSFVAPADAQMSSNTRDRMTAMRAQNPTGYASCHALAVQRGYNDVDQENDASALMHFISGCIMGQQR